MWIQEVNRIANASVSAWAVGRESPIPLSTPAYSVQIPLSRASILFYPSNLIRGQADHLLIMYSMGASHDAPVFHFEGEAVAVENDTFGSVKALFR